MATPALGDGPCGEGAAQIADGECGPFTRVGSWVAYDPNAGRAAALARGLEQAHFKLDARRSAALAWRLDGFSSCNRGGCEEHESNHDGEGGHQSTPTWEIGRAH